MFKKFMAYLVVGCAGVVSFGIAYKFGREHRVEYLSVLIPQSIGIILLFAAYSGIKDMFIRRKHEKEAAKKTEKSGDDKAA